MSINTALILCAGFGKRLNPLTLKVPKPLLKLNNKTSLEICIETILKLGIKKISINTFYLGSQISEYIKKKNFPIEIKIFDEGKEILNTGGGILNMINQLPDNDYIIFNPDTIWGENYIGDIKKMQSHYVSKNLNNILLTTNKNLSFDKSFQGDFELKDNLLKKGDNKDFIYIGCQILNRKIFKKHKVKNFSISEIWNNLLSKDELNGFESKNKFYHLTDLEIFKKLKDL